jgi:hypothetical protein
MVLLDRHQEAAPSLSPVSKSDMLKQAILQNFGGRSRPELVLTKLATIIETVDCYRLTYAEVGHALQVISAHFPPASQ